jgi:hypothetical protein
MSASKTPKYRPSFIFLAIVFIISLSLQTLTQWLEDSISYGNLNLSFTSESLGFSLDILHKEGKFYIAIPERGFSVVVTHGKISRFIRKYRLPVKITSLNILGSIALLILIYGVIFFARNWYNLWQSFKRFISALVGYSHFLLISSFLSVLMLASIFPLAEFLVWWRKFSFIKEYPVPGALERIVYDFMTEFIVMPEHRLFYALFLTLPSFFLRLIVLSSLAGVIIFWMPIPTFMRRLFEMTANLSRKISPKVLFLAGALFLLGAINLKSLHSHHQYPVSAGEISMIFQAKIFQAAKMSYPLPSSKEFFDFPYISNNFKWFSQFAPGWPALLSLGYWLRIPWLLNSLFAIGFFYIFSCFSRSIYDRDTANLSCLLLAISPAFIEISAGFLQYSALFFFLWSFLCQAQKAESAGENATALLAGIFLGIAVNINPKISISFSIPVVFYLLFIFTRRKDWIRGWIFLGATVLSTMPILLYNYFQTGKWLVFGVNHLYGAPLSAQKKPFLDSLIFAIFRLNEINHSLFYWSIPALTFFFVFIILLRTDKERWDYLLIFGFMGSFISHVYYIDSHPGSSNFLLAMIPVFVLFSGRTILLLPKWLSSLNLEPQRTTSLMWVILLWLFLPKIGNLFSSPERMPTLAEKLTQNNIGKALVFMDKDWDKYRMGFGLNHPDLKNSPYIVACDLGDYNRKLISEFPDRPAFLYRPFEDIEFVPLAIH